MNKLRVLEVPLFILSELIIINNLFTQKLTMNLNFSNEFKVNTQDPLERKDKKWVFNLREKEIMKF